MRASIEIDCAFCGAGANTPCLCDGLPVEYIHARRIYDATQIDMNAPANKIRYGQMPSKGVSSPQN